jgi:hypothetical protein
MGLITYADKSALNVNSGISDENKCNASDMNEIKNEVNINVSYTTTEQQVGSWLGEILYRKTINFGNLPNATFKGVNHGISSLKQVTKLYGIWDSGVGNFFNLPYVDTDNVGHSITLYADNTKVYADTEDDYSYATAYIIIEYTKNSVG